MNSDVNILDFRLLGSPQIRFGTRALEQELPTRAVALLAYLAMTGRSHTRLALAALLWPDKDDAGALTNLRQLILVLRRLLPDQMQISRTTLALAGPYRVDALQFEATVTQFTPGDIPSLHAATELYVGDFMQGFYLNDNDPYETWMFTTRERLRDLAFQGWETLADAHARGHDYRAAIQIWSRVLAMEPWREAVHQQMMRLLVLDGRPTAALAQFETCRQTLAEEFGISPVPRWQRRRIQAARHTPETPETEVRPVPPSPRSRGLEDWGDAPPTCASSTVRMTWHGSHNWLTPGGYRSLRSRGWAARARHLWPSRFAHRIAPQFDVVIWRSLVNAGCGRDSSAVATLRPVRPWRSRRPTRMRRPNISSPTSPNNAVSWCWTIWKVSWVRAPTQVASRPGSTATRG
ncbi:MAG: BTAD domain-containing putative transcriptional regulator [Caldilineaceae bacterium]